MSWKHTSRKALTIHVIIAICLAGSALAQRTVYVDGSVAATGDGTLAAPFKTIAEALELEDADLTIRVAGGTYTNEPNNTDILSGQTLIGSYDSTFTTSDPTATPTVIDMGRLTYKEQNGLYTINGASSWTLMNLVIQNSSTGEHSDTENGGALYIRNGSRGTLRGVTFFNCTSRFEGGSETGTAREGGALCIRDDSAVLIEDCVFDSCTAVGGGGAIRIRSARGGGNDVKIHRCLFTNCGSRNSASTIDDGDGASQIEIVNCIFANNGVDVLIPSGVAPSNYELRLADRRALIYNCTFVGSNNPDGFMYDVRDSGRQTGVKSVVNCVFANNTIAGGGSNFAIFKYVDDYNDVITLQNNLFFSNSGLDPLDYTGAGIIGVNGNVAGDPLFADAANGDYRLTAGSPGVDAGQTLALVPDDFAGTTRPAGSAYDIGAIEGQPGMDLFVVQNVLATASSSISADSGPGKTVDGSGLNPSDQHDTTPANMWVSAAGQAPPVRIQYEFDAVYKLDQMWVWNSNSELEWFLGWGVRTATVEYSTDGAAWTELAGVPEFTRAPGAPGYAHDTTVNFHGAAAKFVRITCTGSWGGGAQYSLSEVRFITIPVMARDPYPADGAAGVSADVTLSWTAGREAASHKVYLGTDMQAVLDGTAPAETVSEATYAPASLQPDTTYYWKVVELNEAESPGAWDGPVWSFSTSQYLVVDDFESYTNLSPNRVYQTWIDGLGFSADKFFPDGHNGNGTGGIVGYDLAVRSIMEYAIVHGGSRSMPLSYDGPSETTRTFATPRDWTRHGITTLVVHFYGEAGNSGQPYVKIGNKKVLYAGNAADIAARAWIPWQIELATSGASLASVSTLSIGVDGSTAGGLLYIDDIQLR